MNYYDEHIKLRQTEHQIKKLMEGVKKEFKLDIRFLETDIRQAIAIGKFELTIHYPIPDSLFKPVVIIKTHVWEKRITHFGYPFIMDI